MNVLIDYRHRRQDLENLPLEQLTRFVIDSEGKAENTEVSITFVDNEAIAELNRTYRGKEGPTDVLSFECDSLDDEVTLADDGSRIYELGDVIIAPDVAQYQTKEFGTSFEEEISLLLVHGLLHLCGYDHMEDRDAERMEAREAELLGVWTNR